MAGTLSRKFSSRLKYDPAENRIAHCNKRPATQVESFQIICRIEQSKTELKITWPELAEIIGCTPNQLTGLRTAKYATNMKLAM